ncbi:MAG: DUF4832 domain-containing protein [Thermoanaerobaculum sp.]|nr:DUF4832 domain-containing protein [Thermoanaerobaculum sp.]
MPEESFVRGQPHRIFPRLQRPRDCPPGVVRVRPLEDTQSLYANPGMGWQTFYRAADRDEHRAQLPSTTLYARLTWHELEPEEGNFAFRAMEYWLGEARRSGQRLAWRLMVAGSEAAPPYTPLLSYAPLWLKDQGAAGYIYYFDGNENDRQDADEPDLWAPDLADPVARFYHDRLVAELARRYQSHPFMDSLDIGSVGLWGEWHFWRAVIKQVVGRPPSGGTVGQWVPMPSEEEVRRSIVDTWVMAFPRLPKVMLIGDAAGMRHATGWHRAGWRADCWGDMRWHMPHFYDHQLERTGASHAWRVGPVALEPCWTMEYWQQQGWDIRFILDWALSRHASYLQNKSAPIPPQWLPEVQQALRRIGYRLVLRELCHPAQSSGSSFTITMTWENVGVAPPYGDYLLRVRLTHGAFRWVSPPLLSVKGWQPGPRTETVVVNWPAFSPPGDYELALGVFSPEAAHTHPNLRFVKLAIQTPHDSEGWYVLSRVTRSAP